MLIYTLLAPGTLFRASQFLSEELPIRLAHRVQELGDLPDGLNDMESIKKVQDWYAQSFEVWMDIQSAYGAAGNTACLCSHEADHSRVLRVFAGNHILTEAEPQYRD